jgi:hypothetical protein
VMAMVVMHRTRRLSIVDPFQASGNKKLRTSLPLRGSEVQVGLAETTLAKAVPAGMKSGITVSPETWLTR